MTLYSRKVRRWKAKQYRRQKGKCSVCEKPIPLKEITIDHIVPRAQGGTSDTHNLQLLCQPCNQNKADSLPWR